MKNAEVVKKLSNVIADKLGPKVRDRECVLLDVPYYTNIGDTLIWEGTEQFLRRNKCHVSLTASKDTYDFRSLPQDTLILLLGGGNFGDIWFQHQLFRRRVIETYPDNDIIILPQTVFFNDKDVLQEDADIMSRHQHLTICGRDNVSYQTLRDNYRNDILLVPDMAFCIDPTKIRLRNAKDRKLFFLRKDVELNSNVDFTQHVPTDAEIHEWPTMECTDLTWRDRLGWQIKHRWPKLYDRYWRYVMRPYYVNTGVDFINRYSEVYTTRLHGAILSVLLDKKIVFFDNSYGKNRQYYETWLKDDTNIKFV